MCTALALCSAAGIRETTGGRQFGWLRRRGDEDRVERWVARYPSTVLSATSLGNRALPAFLATEAQSVLGSADPVPASISAIGTLAQGALANACRIGQGRGLAVHSTVHHDLDELLADPDWHLALVLSPFKFSAAGSCDYLGPQAARIGAVDTLVRSRGSLHGLNANSYAIAETVDYLPQWHRPGVTLIVGTGATAGSAVAGLSDGGMHEVFVVGRSYSNAVNLVRTLGVGHPLRDVDAITPDIVVHATTVGEQNDETTLDISLDPVLTAGTAFLDLNTRFTALQSHARSRGCIVLSGVLTQQLTNSLRLNLSVPQPPAKTASSNSNL